jgi:hypothetical protein
VVLPANLTPCSRVGDERSTDSTHGCGGHPAPSLWERAWVRATAWSAANPLALDTAPHIILSPRQTGKALSGDARYGCVRGRGPVLERAVCPVAATAEAVLVDQPAVVSTFG